MTLWVKSTMAMVATSLSLVIFQGVSFAQALPKEFTSPAKVTMLEFSAPWCLSCRKLAPEVETLQKQMGSKLKVQYLNVDKPETQKYLTMFKIESAPTFILYNAKGKEIKRIDRDITPQELQNYIQSAVTQ